jgi:hypothetical protein
MDNINLIKMFMGKSLIIMKFLCKITNKNRRMSQDLWIPLKTRDPTTANKNLWIWIKTFKKVNKLSQWLNGISIREKHWRIYKKRQNKNNTRNLFRIKESMTAREIQVKEQDSEINKSTLKLNLKRLQIICLKFHKFHQM